MKLGKFKIFIFCLIILFLSNSKALLDDKIETVPLLNLEDLSPTFEEDKDELEKIDQNYDQTKKLKKIESSDFPKNDKIYINLTALDKITAKTSSIRLAGGEKKFFGPLEIKALKCQSTENEDISDTVAYLQVKDLSNKDNNQVFIFNGWTFASSPTLRSIDHPVYDLWINSCENI